MPKFDDDVLNGMTDEEREALEGEDDKPADQVRAEADNALQRMNDDKDDDAPAGDDAPAAAAAADSTPPTPAGDPAPDAAAAAAATDAAAPPMLPRLDVPDMSTYATDREKLLDERKALREKWSAGDVSNDDYAQQLEEVNDRIASLDRARDRANDAAAFNEQMERQQYVWTLEQTIRGIKASGGIDYNDPANRPLRVAWDFEVKRLANIKENADKPYEWFLEEANKAIEASTGRVRTPPAPARPKDPVGEAVRARQPDVARAKSLAGLPNAAGDAAGADNEFAELDRLAADPSKGEAFEAALARLSKDQQDRYLSA